MVSPAEDIRSVVSTPGPSKAPVDSSRFRLGITATLTLACLGVAILAAAANLIVVSGPSIIRTMEFVPRVETPVAPRAPVPVPQVPVVQASTPARTDPNALLSAVEQFDNAVSARMQANATDNSLRLQGSNDTVD